VMEMFLRILSLLLCQRVIFVMKEFTRDSQDKLENLVKQVKKHNKDFKRVIVVHNQQTISTRSVLDAIIQKAGDKYAQAKETPDGRIRIDGMWQDKIHGNITYYETADTIHFFLVSNCELKDDQSGWNRKEYNDMVIEAIRSKLYGDTNRMSMNILEAVTRKAQQNMQFFLKDWDSSMRILPAELNEKMGVFVPATIQTPSQELAPNDIFPFNEELSLMTPYSTDAPFAMAKVRVVDVGVQSESLQELQGTWFEDMVKRQIVVYFRAPGLRPENNTSNFIRFSFDRRDNWVEISVKLIAPKLETCTRNNAAIPINNSKGVFRVPFPEDRRFLIPSAGDDFYKNRVKISNGEVFITFDLEADAILDTPVATTNTSPMIGVTSQ